MTPSRCLHKCSLIFGKVLHQQEWLINNFSYDDLNATYEPRGVYQPIMDGPLYGVGAKADRGTDMDWQDAAYLLVGFLLGVTAALWVLIFIAQN